MWRQLSHEPRRLGLLLRRPPPPQAGSHAVQVLRTYPARRRVIPFAPDGERSIARAYLKALGRARSLVYIEGPVPVGQPGRRRPGGGPAPRPRAAHDDRAATPSRPRRAHLRPGRPGRPVAGHQQPHRRRGAASGRLRPGERTGHPDLRPRQGHRGRRRLGDDRLGQPQPPLLDPRLRGRLRGPRPAARPPPPNRPGRPRRWSQGVRPSAPAPPVARAPRARTRRPWQRRPAARPGRRLRGLAGGRGQAPGLARRGPPRPPAPWADPTPPGRAGPSAQGPLGGGTVPGGDRPRRPPLPLRRDTSL